MAKTQIVVTGSTYGLPPEFRPPATRPLAGEKATRPQVPVGWVRLQTDGNDALTVFCELGESVPDPDGGYGGITSVARPGDEPITRFGGYDPFTVPMELIFDATATGGNVNDLYDNLEALAGRGLKRPPGGQSPRLVVDTAGLFRGDAAHFPNERWLLSGLTWSKDEDDQETDAAGNRLLAVADIVLTKVSDATNLQTRAVAARLAHQAANSTKKTYKTVKGDTLITIAKKKLGDAGRWSEIAAINPGFRDPTAKLAANITLYLP